MGPGLSLAGLFLFQKEENKKGLPKASPEETFYRMRDMLHPCSFLLPYGSTNCFRFQGSDLFMIPLSLFKAPPAFNINFQALL